MKLESFRIQNFRSIIDTNWCRLSNDGVTVLVGQNESGKSSILDALSKTFSAAELSSDDVRFKSPLPTVSIRLLTNEAELRTNLTGFSNEGVEAVIQYFSDKSFKTEILFWWIQDTKNIGKFLKRYKLNHDDLTDYLKNIEIQLKNSSTNSAPAEDKPSAAAEANPAQAAEATASPAEEEKLEPVPAITDIARALYSSAPTFVLFQENSGTLPSRIDISDKQELSGAGSAGANNFLIAADLELKSLMESDVRGRAMLLKRANDKITKDFLDFWKQTIGQSNKLTLECDVEIYGADVPEKSGKPSLVFYISDGNDKLYPKQRSKGVSWFVSFYLQLKASEKAARNRFFLLDEPGANLHSKAQIDVLRLINKIRTNIDLIYSTHSPHLIEIEKLYRILAIQREKVDEESPTTVIDAHRLGAASRDTLSAVLTQMGIDLSHQQVIKKRNNVLLEEISAFYYLHAFWKLANSTQEVQFIPTSGVANVPIYANCFLGWGIDFAVVVDDESSGRQVYNQMKKELFRDEEALAQKKLMKISGCTGIEDIFSINDFKKFVLKDETIDIRDKNSIYVKNKGVSKILIALNFKMTVDKSEILLTDLSPETSENIKQLVEAISERVRNDILS